MRPGRVCIAGGRPMIKACDLAMVSVLPTATLCAPRCADTPLPSSTQPSRRPVEGATPSRSGRAGRARTSAPVPPQGRLRVSRPRGGRGSLARRPGHSRSAQALRCHRAARSAAIGCRAVPEMPGVPVQSCVAAGAGRAGAGRRLRGAAERGGWARMWSRTRVMTSRSWSTSWSDRGSSSRRVTWMWPGMTRPGGPGRCR